MNKAKDRLTKLCDYFNSINDGYTKASNDELMELFDYNNRKTLYRDLKSLQDDGYIVMDTSTATPVSITKGTATQYIRRYRTIRFIPTDYGLQKIHKDRYIAPGYTLYEDELHNEEWMISPYDHTLIRNENYIKAST